MNTETTKEHLTALRDIATNGEGIECVVAQDALDLDEYAIGYLEDVLQHGCVSGACSGLIYYTDTHAFYREHAGEIDEILAEYEEGTGEAFKFEGRDVQNTLAWMGYEEVARKVLEKCGVEW